MPAKPPPPPPMLLPRGNSSSTPRPYMSPPPFRLPLRLTDLYNKIRCDERRRRRVKEHVPPPHRYGFYYYSGRQTAFVCADDEFSGPRIETTIHNIHIYYYIFFSLFVRSALYVSSDDSGLINVLRFVVVVVVVFNLCIKNKINEKKLHNIIIAHMHGSSGSSNSSSRYYSRISCISIVVVVYC